MNMQALSAYIPEITAHHLILASIFLNLILGIAFLYIFIRSKRRDMQHAEILQQIRDARYASIPVPHPRTEYPAYPISDFKQSESRVNRPHVAPKITVYGESLPSERPIHNSIHKISDQRSGMRDVPLPSASSTNTRKTPNHQGSATAGNRSGEDDTDTDYPYDGTR